MSKLKKVLEMIAILSTGCRVTTDELAEVLGVSSRTISNYANEIRDMGLPITSAIGSKGGYYFVKIINGNKYFEEWVKFKFILDMNQMFCKRQKKSDGGCDDCPSNYICKTDIYQKSKKQLKKIPNNVE